MWTSFTEQPKTHHFKCDKMDEILLYEWCVSLQIPKKQPLFSGHIVNRVWGAGGEGDFRIPIN